ncbi:MAG: 50S ribosomal protein L25 [Spirochaetia bacterium]|jgi:large subunit ribosomal protein L25|nr:50S ribosomal protein L25 [Spirochaetia bacterium]
METKMLQAELRDNFGKNVNNRLRASGFIPAVIYSHGTTQTIKITEKALFDLFKGRVSENIIFDLKIPGNDDVMAFVKDYQTDPVSEKITHLDLFRVTKDEKIHTRVPLEFAGIPVGTKSGGNVEIYHHEIQIECFPKDLPEKIVVDISSLDIDKNIHAKDIPFDESIKLVSNPELVIVAVHSPKVVEETPAAEVPA